MKQNASAVRVLVVEEEGLGQPSLDRILDAAPMELVRARSFKEARELLRSQSFDVVIADDTQLRGVLDAIFAFVGLFSLGGVVLDVNQAPLASSGLRRDQVVGHRFVELPWFAHSAEEQSRISAAIAVAARGEPARLETHIRSTRGVPMWIDASFTPLRDKTGLITHVVGSGVDITSRKAAEEARAASESRLAEAQRVAHIGNWEWTIAENRVRWSDELYRIYGLTEAGFVPTYESFLSRVEPKDLEHTKAVLGAALENVTPFIYDHRIRRSDGSVRMLHTRGEVIGDAEGRAVRLVGSCWDITDRWEAMRDLQQSVSTLTATLEATADGILVGDLHGRVAALNRRFLALWRLPSDVGPGADIRQLAESVRRDVIDPDAFMTRLAELYGDAEKEGLDVIRFKDGRVLERYSVPQRVGSAICGRVCSFRDVTQREHLLEQAATMQAALRASNDRLRALAARLDSIREEERRVMAREIHDQIGQALTALKLDLGWVRKQMDGHVEDAVAARAAAMDTLIDHTLETARRVSADLRPAILDDLGLGAALRWHGRELEERTGLVCELQLPSERPPLGPDAALALFRIAQEALTNVARHAAARRARIALEVGADAAELTISDDGRGATTEELGRTTSLGVVGMHERALVVGGSVTITGSPGGGTIVVARVPTAGRDFP